MSKKQTLFEQRTAQRRLREERLAQGLCSECGERERTRNMDGSKSVRCAYCKERAERHMATHNAKRPPKRDGDLIDDLGYLNTPRFYDYAARVKRLIERASFPPSIADQKRALGDNFIERMHIDALDYLMGDGAIRERQSGAMMRYEPAVRHDRNQSEYRAFPGNVSQQVSAA